MSDDVRMSGSVKMADEIRRDVPQGWQRHPNLQLRPHAPNKGRGRLQRQIARAFIEQPYRSTSEVYDWCYARDRSRTRSEAMRWSVRRILDATCDRIGRANTPGRPWIWRLR
jgi:hypothetical protein